MKRASRRARRAWAWPVAGVLVAGAGPAQAQADIFRFGSWNGLLVTDFESDHERTRASGSKTDFSVRTATESATIGNAGFTLVDESILTGSLSLTFGGVQQASASDAARTSSDSTLLGYGFNARMLGLTPYAITTYASRSQSVLAQSFGRTRVTLDDAGAQFQFGENSFLLDRYDIAFFSSSLGLNHQHVLQDSYNVYGQHLVTDQTTDGLGYSGHKGFLDSDLTWNYSLARAQSLQFARGNSTAQSANLAYNGDFGAARNRHWDSRIAYSSFETTDRNETASISENVRLEHRSDLASSYSYVATRINAPSLSETSQSGSAGLNYSWNRNLSGEVLALLSRMSLPGGSMAGESLRMHLRYVRSLPADGRVTLQATDTQMRNDNRLSTSRLLIVDEAHAAPAQLGAGAGFTLGQPFVETSSIVVTDTRGGVRVRAVLGVDYETLPEGNSTRIVPLLSSLIIQQGDPLLVSYTRDVDPSLRFRTSGVSTSASLDFPWISLGASHEESSQTMLDGQPGRFLTDYHSNSVSTDLRASLWKVGLTAGAGYTRYDSNLLGYRQERAYQSAYFRPVPRTMVSLNCNWSRTDYWMTAQQVQASSAVLSMDRYAGDGWSTNASLSHRRFSVTHSAPQSIDAASVLERFAYGSLTASLRLEVNRTVQGPVQADNWRLQFFLSRAF
jgi:hypothetical protein